MAVLSSACGCAPAAEPASGRVLREGAFVDVTLPIAEHEWSDDGSLTVVARGMINREAVSIAVDLAPHWKSQRSKNTPITVYRGKGHIRSVGAESDAFLALLAREYALARPGQMASRTEVTMVGLGSNPGDLRSTPAKIKIFFEAGGEDSYGEAFINIDLGTRILEFRDKDPEYHRGVLASLQAAPK